MKIVEARFVVLSRHTTTHDCFILYLQEKKKLKEFFVSTKQRVCLTIETWSSCQNLHYMCLTAHFVDEDWRPQKKVLNYCVVPNRRVETIRKAIEQCLLDWGIERVFCVTIDNASSNDISIQYLVGPICDWSGAILRGLHMQLRCAAHILNLIVTDALKDHVDVITKIRNVVRFVRGSGARM